jgi:hypothetical protein
MSQTTLIRQSEANFKLAQKIITSLSESFNFSFEDGWANICNTNIDALKRKFKKDSKKNNPYSVIKNPRTSFSFYTKENRANIQKKNPKATFGQLSKLVSAEWNNLTDKEKKVYKKKELTDKGRYTKERDALAKKLESEAASQPAVEENLVSPTPTPAPSSKSSKKASKSSKSSGKTASKSSSPSSYNVFQKKMRPQLKTQFPDAPTKEITSKLGEAWRALSDSEKATYA